MRAYYLLFIVASLFLSSCSGGDSSSGVKSPNENAAAVNYIESQAFVGTVLFKKAGADIVRQGFGLANKAEGIENVANTRFRIASLTKAFTALSIVQLKNRHLIRSYDDAVSSYLSDFDNNDITIRQLLNHRSGLPDYVYTTNPNIAHTPAQLFDKVKSAAVEFTPGSEFSYSNSNYMVLGYLIEQLTGQDYFSYLQAEVLSVLGTTTIEYGSSNISGTDYAQGYQNAAQTELSNFVDMSVPYAAGALSSDLRGLEVWADSFAENLLVDDEDKQAIFAEGDYSFGWIVTEISGKKAYTHTGGIDGFSTIIAIFPDDRSLIVALSNIENTHDTLNKVVSKLSADYL